MKKIRLCPVGTEIQSIIFSKENFNEKEARNWAERNDFKYKSVDEKENTYRLRQSNPINFKKESFRTIELSKGVQAVIGCPIKKYEYGGSFTMNRNLDKTRMGLGGKPYQIYHNTLSSALEESTEYAKNQGYETIGGYFPDITIGGVGYGETKRTSIELIKDGKPQKKQLNIQIYRMDNGKYELNNYIFKDGGSIDDIFEIITYYVTAHTNSFVNEIYIGTDYNKAVSKFNSSDTTEDVGSDLGGTILFQKKTEKYKFVGDLEEGTYDISDFPVEDFYNDKDYYKLIEEGEIEDIDSKEVKPVNEKSDELLYDVKKYYGGSKYNTIVVDNGEKEDSDNYQEYGCIQLRIADHSENVKNIDRAGNCEYYISVVIANKDVTKGKFAASVHERKRNEVELNFYGYNTFYEIISDIDSAIENGKNYILGKDKMENGGGGGEDKTRIANEIIRQLGGMGRLNASTGAYNFIALPNGVSFRIKNQRANYIKITLSSLDLYDLEVGRIRGDKYTVVVKKEGLYNDMLKPVIQNATGMYLSFDDGGLIESLKTKKESIEKDIAYLKQRKEDLSNNLIRPHKIIGTGIKPQYARKLAFEWLDEKIAEQENNLLLKNQQLNALNEGKDILLYEINGKKVISEDLEKEYPIVEYANGNKEAFSKEKLENLKAEYFKNKVSTEALDKNISERVIPYLNELLEPKSQSEVLTGGKGDKLTLEEIAKKHKVSLDYIKAQFEKGVKIESEHTNNKEMQEEIAKDHLTEFPNYYEALEDMESKLKSEQKDVKEVQGYFIDIPKDKYSIVNIRCLLNGIKCMEIESTDKDKRRMFLTNETDYNNLNDYINSLGNEPQATNFIAPQNLSKLKNTLKVGDKLKITSHYFRPTEIGQIRVIEKTQTNGLWFINDKNPVNPIWLEYPKTELIQFTDKGFAIYFKDKPDVKMVEYEYYFD